MPPLAPASTWISRVALLAGATAMGALALAATQARADDLVVRYDQSQLLRLRGHHRQSLDR